jgi:hypothetical protein
MTLAGSVKRWCAHWNKSHEDANEGTPPARGYEVTKEALGGHQAECFEVSAQELPHLLRAVSLDPEVLDSSDGETMREMRRACSTCMLKQQVPRGPVAGNLGEKILFYCPAARKIAVLRSSSWWKEIALV